MLFNSFAFVIFVIVTMALYYMPFTRRFQVWLLILSSFFFYAYNNPTLLLLLLASTLVTALLSHAVFYDYKSKQYLWMVCGVAVSLGILAFFKYSPLIAKTLLPRQNAAARFIMLIPLPIGISFFTFEGVSLIVDAFRARREGAHPLVLPPGHATHIRNTAFFVSFFPHLIAGPIIKAHQFFPQIETKRFRDIDWERAFKCLVMGYFLKMVVADNLKDQTFWIDNQVFQIKFSSLTLIFLVYGYSMQIFADFAGYSLIAIGVAELFGYELMTNFNFPYIARSFGEFWQRWHISLSTWLKEYLYVPLGGNRKGNARTYAHLLVVMFLGGLWHGAAWSYAVWGTWHGMLLLIERGLKKRFTFKEGLATNALSMAVVFFFVTVGWLFFKLPEFGNVIFYFRKITTNLHLAHDWPKIIVVCTYSAPVILYHAYYLLKKKEGISRVLGRFDYILYAIALFLILTNSGSSNEFIYFQF
ncbi:MAG: MBOAT family protein [Deltaproteobacteria bacterium]|nr:MBOAT family protein [Deltaproteobacteria bacterium]